MQKPAAAVQPKPVTWILVADGRQAEIYIRKSVERRIPLGSNGLHRHYQEIHEPELVPVGVRLHAESRDEYDASRRQLGRVFESATPARSIAEPRLDVREEIRQHFAKEIAERLENAEFGGAFDRLVLIAPPKILGELKKHLRKSVLNKVIAELPKELTHQPERVLTKQLENVVI
jgi:protein required for attachment to host cells